MTKKLKLGFLAFHPGAANTLTKIIHQARLDGHDVYCYPFLPYAEEKWGVETLYTDGMDFFNTLPTDFDFFLYSSAAGSIVEKYLPIFCKKNNIISISTIDVFWITEKEIEMRFDKQSYPDIIITPEKSVADMIKNIGLPSKVFNLGNPHLEINKQEQRVIDDKNKSIAYISYPENNNILANSDKQSKIIMNELIELVREDDTIKQVYICLHPRESATFVKKLLLDNPDVSNRICLNPYISTTNCCIHVDVIIGVTSTVLYEEYLRGRAVLFYKNKEHMKKSLSKSNELYNQKLDFTLPINSVENILQLLQDLSLNKDL